jgi:hypothetical protein
MSRLLCSFALRAMRYPAVVRSSACLTQAVRASSSSHSNEPTKTHGHAAEEHGHGHGHGGPAEAFVIHGGKVVDPTAEVASPLGGAIGPERFEQLKALAGIDDPYDLSTKPLVRALAPEQANLVPSSYDHRVAGCVCERDQEAIYWFNVYRGVPARCKCGYFFRLCNWDEWETATYGVGGGSSQKSH